MSRKLRELLSEALKHYSMTGYTSEAELQAWLTRLHLELEAELPTDPQSRASLEQTLRAVYDREFKRGIIKRVPGISRYTLARISPSLRAELDRRIFAGVGLIKLNKKAATEKTLQRFAGWVSSVPAGGSSETDLRSVASEILKPVKQVRFEARRVAIDQAHKLSSAVAHISAVQHGAIAAVWHDRGQYDRGYDARPEHLKRSGRLFLVRDSWAAEKGLVKRGGPYTDEIEQPAELPYCFPGETPIQWANGVEVGYRRWYSGELTEIITGSGKTLRATPNHPILTPHGFVACGSLQEGDDVIEIAKECVERVMPELANDQAVPTIAEIFGSLAVVSARSEVSGGRDQFHGDGTESNVDIVRAARPLTFDFVTPRAEGLNQFSLAKSNLRRTTLRALQLLLQPRSLAAALGVGGQNTVLAPFWATLRDGEVRGILQGSNQTPRLDYTLGDRPSGYSEFGGERLNGLSQFVAATKIVNVKRSDFSGHVYNLQTADGWYTANGIIAHNCSCYYEYTTSPRSLPSDLLTAAGVEWVKG